MISYFFRGIAIGLLFGLPAGAVGALTIQRTWNNGGRAGLLTGLGSSTADCFYACVGVFGLTFISDFLFRYQSVINTLGGCLILLMGFNLFRTGQKEYQNHQKMLNLPGTAGIILSSFAVGITNPAAILTFLFAFSWFGITGQSGFPDGTALVAGVFTGTYFWWGTLTGFVLWLKKRAGKIQIKRINQLFGTVLCGFGMIVLIRNFLV